MPLLEEGIYYGKLLEIGTDKLQNEAGTEYVYVAWEVTHQAAGGQWRPITPTRRESRWWATQKAEPYTMDRLVRLGFNGDLENPAFDAEPHPQRDGVELACRHDHRDGKAYENWDLASGHDRERVPWDSELKRRFKAKYRTRLSTQARPEGKPDSPPAAPSGGGDEPDNSPVRDDELPAGEEVADVPESEIPF